LNIALQKPGVIPSFPKGSGALKPAVREAFCWRSGWIRQGNENCCENGIAQGYEILGVERGLEEEIY